MQTHSTYRYTKRSISNNISNPNQNICALTIANHFSKPSNSTYLHTLQDLITHIQTTNKTTTTKKFNNLTIHRANSLFIKYSKTIKPIKYYLIYTHSHTALLNNLGQTIIDTAPNHNNTIQHTIIIY